MNSQQVKKTRFPDKPGVYFFKKGNTTIYIGKATSLRSRVRSYFGKDLINTRGPMILDMVTLSTNIEWQETDSVLESLILEANLIKKYKPKYNTKEKDNKSYNYVVITDEAFPKVLIERGKNIDFQNLTTSNYKLTTIFGPFPHGSILKEALKIVRKIFPFIDKQSSKKDNYEFYHQLGLTPDIGNENARKEYAKTICHIKLFFKGKKKELIKSLGKEMSIYAKKQEFEKAGKVKKTLYALNHIRDVSLLKRDMTDVGKALRIEAYDVAHLSGTNMVGVMTVMEDGVPEKTEYRKFKIKTVTGANDPAALKEIILRRLGHTEWPYPSVIVVDGNDIQLNLTKKILGTAGLSKINVVAVVKNEKHKPENILGDKQLIISYKHQILLVNAEAHRFAIAFHRQKRGKL